MRYRHLHNDAAIPHHHHKLEVIITTTITISVYKIQMKASPAKLPQNAAIIISKTTTTTLTTTETTTMKKTRSHRPYVSTNLESLSLLAITEAEYSQPVVSIINNKTTRLLPPTSLDAVNATLATTLISVEMTIDSWKTKILQKYPRPKYQLH